MRLRRFSFTLAFTILALSGCSSSVEPSGREKSHGDVESLEHIRLPPVLVSTPKVNEGDHLYGVGFNFMSLLDVNPKTGLVKKVGHIGHKFGGIEDITLDPKGRPIVVYWEGYPGLLRVDLKTGAATLGPKIRGATIFERATVEALAVVDGILYGAASDARSHCSDCADHLIKIDPETGDASDLGKFGPEFLNMEAMAYSPKFGLIGADIGIFTGDGKTFVKHPTLVKIDPKTARATKIGNLPPADVQLGGNEVNSYITPKGPFIAGLTFAPDDTLYAVTIPTHFGGLSELWVVDPLTAATRMIGMMNATNVDGLLYVPASKAIEDSATEKPTPSP